MQHKRADLIADFTKWSGGFPPESRDQITVYLDYALPIVDTDSSSRFDALLLLQEWLTYEGEEKSKNRPFLAVCACRDIIERRGIDTVKADAIKRCEDEYRECKKYELVSLLMDFTKVGVIGYDQMDANALAAEIADDSDPCEIPEGVDENDECALTIAAMEEMWGTGCESEDDE